MSNAHRHDTIELNFAESGELVYLFGGAEVVLESGFVSAFWGITPHQLVHCPTGSTVHWLTIPLPSLVSWGLPNSFVNELLQGAPLVSTAPASEHGDPLQFGRWERELGSGSSYDQLTASLEIQARLRRLAREVTLTVAEQGMMAGHNRVNRHVAAIATFIARHHTDPIGIDDIAETVHLHPHYAMGLFRAATGMTMNSYLTQCRVAAAQRLLLTTEMTVVAVGAAVGFQSQSQFYEAFRSILRRTTRHLPPKSRPQCLVDQALSLDPWSGLAAGT